MEQPPSEGPTEDPADRPGEPLLITDDMLAPAAPLETRIDFERGMSLAPKLSLALIVANIAVFLWQLSVGALESKEAIVAAGALERNRVLAGEVWRLFTAMFLHGSVGHLLGNCTILYILGMACEHGLGVAKTALVYIVSGLAGSLLSLAASPGPSVGASGAIFGLSGAVILFMYRNRNTLFVRDKRIGGVLLVWALYQIIVGFTSPVIDNFAHIGGFLGGAAVTLGLKLRRELRVS